MGTCDANTRWGRCLQTKNLTELDGDWLCPYHAEMRQSPTFHEDTYYHQKIAKAETLPTVDYITQAEMDALLRGRPRQDGRRLDQWARQ
jgi:hypothetical protein